jgi:hypothetical protein
MLDSSGILFFRPEFFMQITLLERRTLTGIGALSGAVVLGSDLYVVGDDAGYLLHSPIDHDVTRLNFNQISLLPDTGLSPLPKSEKPDFEAMTEIHRFGKTDLLIMGSGSTPKRMQALLFDPVSQAVTPLLDARDYAFLAQHEALTHGADLNIEAICAHDAQLYIFQRGNINRHHGVLRCDLLALNQPGQLAASVLGDIALALPDIAGCASGIADACLCPSNSLIYATASVEQTANTYDDGAVLGSLIVRMSVTGKVLDTAVLVDDAGQPLPIKVEGITWLRSELAGEVFLLVTDSDGGDSEMLLVRVS